MGPSLLVHLEGVDTKLYYHVQFCFNFRMYGNKAFLGVCMTGWALSHNLMVYLPGNWPMPWNLSGNVLIRSSVELIEAVFVGIAGAGVGPGRWEVPWMTLTVQFILTTSNFSHEGNPRMAGPGVSATYQQELIWWGCALGEQGCQMTGP